MLFEKLQYFYNIAQSFYLCNVVLGVLRPKCRHFFPAQSCLEPLRQHCTGKNTVQYYLNIPGTLMHPVRCVSAREAPDNIALEKYCTMLF